MRLCALGELGLDVLGRLMGRAWILVMLVACGGDDKPAPSHREDVQTPPRQPVPLATAKELSDALSDAPYAYRVTAKPCPVDYPKTGENVVTISVERISDVDVTPHGVSGTLETIVVHESGSIGRIYVWDRAAKVMVCAAVFNTTEDPVASSPVHALVKTEDSFPKPPDHLPARVGKRVLQVSSGENHTCVLVENGTVHCFGQNDMGQADPASKATMVGTPSTIRGITDAVEISSASDYTCARRKSNTVTCWGANSFGQLGAGRDADHQIITSSIAAVGIAASNTSMCALRADGSVTCWGALEHKDAAPRRVKNLPPAAEICAGSNLSCARVRTGGVQCFGDGEGFGEMLVGSRSATKLACGGNAREICWIDGDHVAHCTTDHGEAVELPDPKSALMIQFAWDHACELHLDGTVDCWGKNEFGQLGDGKEVVYRSPVPTRPLHLPPSRVASVSGAKALELGSERTAVITADDGLATWGYGPIGDGRDCSGPPCDGLAPTMITFP
jgi:alpha-tubulin suppressor-like RCC1 family protein